ncbi:hypothetical protein Tco_0386993 [Tanacetum coccineum]
MAEPILSNNLEKAPTESNLSITSNDINIELSKEFFVELRKNIYHETYNENVVDHIVKNGGLLRKSPLRRNLLRNSSVDDEMNELKESKYENPSNIATDSFFKAYEVRDIEKHSQTKRKYSNTSNSIKELPNKRRCKAEKFKAIQYSLGPIEEYIAITSYEYDIWEKTKIICPKSVKIFFRKRTKDEK